MASKTTKTTIDHAEIKRWAEERDAQPSVVKGVKGPGTGILRLDLPGYSGQDSLAPIEWDEWLQKFDESKLAFVYQDETVSGVPSNFNKLVSRETANLRNDETGSKPTRSRSVSRSKNTASSSRSQAGGARRAPARGSNTARTKAASSGGRAAGGRHAGAKAAKKRA